MVYKNTQGGYRLSAHGLKSEAGYRPTQGPYLGLGCLVQK